MNSNDLFSNDLILTKTIDDKEFEEPNQTLQKRWKQLLKFVKSNVSSSSFRTWFLPLKPISITKTELVVEVPSQFYCEWLDQHYYSLLRTCIQKFFGEEVTLKYQVVVDNSNSEKINIKLPSQNSQKLEQIRANFIQKLEYDPNLVKHFNFENFVVGDSNQFAYSCCLAVAKNPKQTKYNPLIIYGNTGLGKTHLLQAIGNYILLNHTDVKVLYSTSENFANNFIEAIKNNNMNDFVNLYRNVDVLLIDDIQFFQNKGKIQDHFFHTFNTLHQAGKNIVLTSDKPPKDLKDIDERLISRFQWGLLADIQPPELETRIAITRKKSENEGIELPDQVIEYIAQNITSNVREIEGVIVSLIAQVAFSKKKPTVELVREILRSKHIKTPRIITIDKIKNAVANYYNLNPQELESKSRRKEVTIPRQLAMYIAKEFTNITLQRIGKNFGGRDHTTVLYAINTIERNLLVDERLKAAYEYIVKKLI
ncbi:MAG: chromosomal replication initiator protein DnaA [Ignavibacteria bacterium]|nr:chromosomal replication initiator protein DnaA [Ignavibacteria bacterium]